MTSDSPPARMEAMDAIRDKPLLRRSSPEPLYRQLAQHLETEIRSGRLKNGDRLESESVLSERFAVSRITVRQAIEELVRKQIVVRKQGKGTFVTDPTVKHDLRRLHGLLGSLFSQAERASTKLLRCELAAAPAVIAELLGIRAGGRALRLDRLFQIGGRPIALAQVWLAPEVAALPRAKADLISTEDMMRAAGIRIASSEVSIRAEAAGTTVGDCSMFPSHAGSCTSPHCNRRRWIGQGSRLRVVLFGRLRVRLHVGKPGHRRGHLRYPQRRGTPLRSRPRAFLQGEYTMARTAGFLRIIKTALAGFAAFGSMITATAEALAQGAPIPVRFTIQPRTGVTSLVEIAIEKGFFKDPGIDAKTEVVAHGPAAVTALASGGVDVATNAPEVFLALAGKGQPLKLIAGQTRQISVLASRPGLEVPASFPDFRPRFERQEDRRHGAQLRHALSRDCDPQCGWARGDRRSICCGRLQRAAGALGRPHRRGRDHGAADRDVVHAGRAFHG